MGKFDGVLLYTDYDDTLYNQHHTVSQENHRAIRYFMEQGGRFSIATGRAKGTFAPQIQKEGLAFNAPVIVANGAGVYDFHKGAYVVRTWLGEDIPRHIEQLCRHLPQLSFEAYHGDEIYVHNPNQVTLAHLHRVAAPYQVCPIARMPTPWMKVLLEQDHPVLEQAQEYVQAHWGQVYEVIFSNPYLLEVTAKGANKGSMVCHVARLLGIAPEHVYCIGDNQNDIPMLAVSAIPFAPENCAQPVKDWGARLVGHTNDHAVAQVIEILDGIYQS